MQPGGARLQRAQHDSVARQDEAAEELAFSVDRLDRDRGADHHDHHGARAFVEFALLRQHAMARADHRHPAVGAEPRRMVVAVDDARLRRARHHPARRAIEALVDLFFGATPHRIARHHAAEHRDGRDRQIGPRTVGQLLDVIEKLGPRSQRDGTGTCHVVEGPLEPGIADIDREKRHARDYQPRRLSSASTASHESASPQCVRDGLRHRGCLRSLPGCCRPRCPVASRV